MKDVRKGALLALFWLFLAFLAFPASGERGDFDIATGDLKATLHRELGTFSLYKLRPTGKGRYDPLLDTRNYGAGNYFAVSVNGRVHVLEKKAFNKIDFEASDGGDEASFIFTPSDDFQAVQRFSIKEIPAFGQTSHVLAIEVSVENTSDKPIRVAWRAVFDTMLGESRSSARGHFLTDTGRIINSETLVLPSAASPRALFSSNGERTCAFLLSSGLGAPSPSTVYIANWSRCDSLLRGSFSRPVECEEGRSLSSVYSPNDSAVLMEWREVTLNSGESSSVTVYLSALDAGSVTASSEGAGKSFVESLDEDSSDDVSSDDATFRERQALYFRVVERLRQLESGAALNGADEIAELERILDYLLESAE